MFGTPKGYMYKGAWKDDAALFLREIFYMIDIFCYVFSKKFPSIQETHTHQVYTINKRVNFDS